MPQDLTDPAFLADPAPRLAALRDAAPLARTRLPLIGPVWVTTTDAAARALLHDPRFRRDPAAAGGRSLTRTYWWLPGFVAPLTQNILLKDGADHARLRRLVDRAFARGSIDDLRPRLTALADGLLDGLDPARPVDIVATYCRRLPLLAIAEMLGLAPADRDRLARLVAPVAGPTGLPSFAAALPNLWRVLRALRAECAAVRRQPRPGLLTALVEAEASGDRLTEDELLSLVFTLFVAGHETTVHLIGGAILALIDDPAARARFMADPAGRPLAVEELVRWISPVMMTKMLYARENLEFQGIAVARGEVATALLLAANHDPARVPDPEALHLDRRPNAHLGFGHGPHACLGMQLARAETQIALERLFARFPDLALAGPRDAVRYRRRLGFRALRTLGLRLRP